MRVSFFLPREADLATLAGLDPDRAAPEFRRGERAWILQSQLRLSRAGFPCELVGRVPDDGLVLFHAKHERDLRRGVRRGSNAVLVGIRADNREPLAAEFEIVQNGRFAAPGRRFAIPHWPQPGLVPRDALRGDAIRRVAYKGFLANLHPDFRGERWRRFLADREIEWVVDAREFDKGSATERAALDWADFSAVDVVVAVRPPARKTDFSKPATKLVNAWLAGVPALLGPEYAFRELRRSELDYLEVDSLGAAERAIERLVAEPELYRAMVENGRRRAVEVDVAAVTARWIELLGTTLSALAADPARTRRRRGPLALRRARHLLERWREGRPPR
jgi:hypothetical protein